MDGDLDGDSAIRGALLLCALIPCRAPGQEDNSLTPNRLVARP